MTKKLFLSIMILLSAVIFSTGCSGSLQDAYAKIELCKPIPPASELGVRMRACPYGQGWGDRIQLQLPLSSTIKQLNVMVDGNGNVIGKLCEDRTTICLVTVVKVQAKVSIELEIPDEWFKEPPREVNWQALAAATNIIDATLRTFSYQPKFAGEILPPPLSPMPRTSADLLDDLLEEISALPEMDALRQEFLLPPRPKPEKNIATYIALAVALMDRMPNQLGAARKTTLRNFAAELDGGTNNLLGATSSEYRTDFQGSGGRTFRIIRLTDKRFAIEVEDVQSYTPTQENLMSISEG